MSHQHVQGRRFVSKDGDVAEGIGYGVTRGFDDKKRNGENVVVYKDPKTHLIAVRSVKSFFDIYTVCGHERTEVRGSLVYCCKCDTCFGVD